jgi:hypothetical protein
VRRRARRLALIPERPPARRTRSPARRSQRARTSYLVRRRARGSHGRRLAPRKRAGAPQEVGRGVPLPL